MKKKSKSFATAVSIVCIANFIFAFSVVAWQDKPKDFALDRKHKLLVFAAHQDDCVIEAGGLVPQNVKSGGEADIVYLTRPADRGTANIRKKEASRAWSLLNSDRVRLTFLDYGSEKNWSEEKKASARSAISSTVARLKPDLVIAPLREGGHPEHDLLNTLVYEAMVHFPRATVLQAAEYNPYYVMRNTPVKTLWLLVRLAPLIPYKEPNYGLVPKNQVRLRMTPDQLLLKKKMLAVFESQASVINEGQFGYADLFENTVSPPEGCLTIKGKFISPWALITVLLTFLMMWSWGLAAAIQYGNIMAYFIAVLTLCVLFALIVKGPLFILEELLFPIDFLLGATCGKLVMNLPLKKKVIQARINQNG